MTFQVVLVIKNLPSSAGDVRGTGLLPRSERSPEGGNGNSPLFLPGESQGHRRLAVCGPLDHKESDTTEGI